MISASIKYRYNKVLVYLLDGRISDKVSLDAIACQYLDDDTDVKIKEILYEYMLSELSSNKEDLNRYLEKIISISTVRGPSGTPG